MYREDQSLTRIGSIRVLTTIPVASDDVCGKASPGRPQAFWLLKKRFKLGARISNGVRRPLYHLSFTSGGQRPLWPVGPSGQPTGFGSKQAKSENVILRNRQKGHVYVIQLRFKYIFLKLKKIMIWSDHCSWWGQTMWPLPPMEDVMVFYINGHFRPTNGPPPSDTFEKFQFCPQKYVIRGRYIKL